MPQNIQIAIICLNFEITMVKRQPSVNDIQNSDLTAFDEKSARGLFPWRIFIAVYFEPHGAHQRVPGKDDEGTYFGRS